MINRITMGNSSVYNAKSFFGNTISGGNLASLNSDLHKTIVGRALLNITAPTISNTHIFSFCLSLVKNCADQNGNVNPMNK